MDGTDLFKIIAALLTALGGIGAGVWWLLKQCFATKDDHRTLKEAHSELEMRVLTVENAVKNLPTITHHNEMYVKLVEIGGNVKNTEEKVGRQQRQTDRIEDFLFKGGFNQ